MLLLGIMLISIGVAPTYAHFLETNGKVGATIHIDPDDDPIVGQPATIYFDIKNKSNTFKLSECNCKVTILKDGRWAFYHPLTELSVSYTFPAKGTYTIKLSGTPYDEDAYEPFTMSQTIKVDRVDSGSTFTLNFSSFASWIQSFFSSKK